MIRAMYSTIAYLLLLVGLMAGYRGAKQFYKPQFPAELDAGIRESKLGVLLYNCKWVNEGVALCRQSVIESPNSAMPHYQLAVLYHQQGMPLEAIVEYREAIRCQPDWAEAHISLGLVLKLVGRLEEAIEEFRRAGENPVAQENLERAERELQRVKLQQDLPGR